LIRSIVALVLLFWFSTACALTIEETMYFETQERMRITVFIKGCEIPNLSLTWPIASSQILEPPEPRDRLLGFANVSGSELTLLVGVGEPGTKFSFLVRFPCQTGENHVLPAARCRANVSGQTLQVLLPEGWTAPQWSPGCTKTYDVQAGRIRLYWPDAGTGSCEAVILSPGVGEKEIRWRMTWMAIRGYLLIGSAAAFIILAAILLYRLAAGPNRPGSDS